MQIGSKQDTIPGDFPWDKCRKLYSVPNGFAARFLEGKCHQDFEYLTTATFIDAKTIMTEWIRHFNEVKSRQVSVVAVFAEPDQKFLENLLQRANVLPGEQYFLILAVIFLAQCTRRREIQLLESFFAAHDADKVKTLDINAPEVSWLDLAELLSISLSKLRPVIRERAVITVDSSSQKSRLRNKRAAVDDTFVYDAHENLQLRRRRGRTNDPDNMDEPSHASIHNQRVALSQNQPVATGGYFVIPKQLCGLSQSCAGVEFPSEDYGLLAHVEALLLPENVDTNPMMQFMPDGGENDIVRNDTSYYQDGGDGYEHDYEGNSIGGGYGGSSSNSHRYSSRVSFNEYPMGNNYNTSLVSRRQKKNKKMFILTVKTETDQETKTTQPISMKGIVALETLRYRVQLNAFQNEKKKFSRNSSDLHDALWIFEVTLLISDGPTTLDQQFRIGNYYALQRGLGRPFDVMFKTPLEYFCELGRQISVFYHTRRDVFPQHLINLAVTYFDNMKVIVNERSPTTASTTIVDHEREEALRAEELNHLRQHELWLLQNHSHLHPSWSMVYKAMKAQCSLAEVTSMSCVTLFRQVPSLYTTPKLSMTTVMIDDVNSAYFSSHPGPHPPPPPSAAPYTLGPPGSLQALVVHAESISAAAENEHVNETVTMQQLQSQEQRDTLKSDAKPPQAVQSSIPKLQVLQPPTIQQQQFLKQMPKPIQRAVVVPEKPVALPVVANSAPAMQVPVVAPPTAVLPEQATSKLVTAAPVKTVHFQPLPQVSSDQERTKHGAGKAMKAVSAMAASVSSSTSSSPAVAAPAGKITLSEALKFIAQSSTSATTTTTTTRNTTATAEDQPVTAHAVNVSEPVAKINHESVAKANRGRKPGSRAPGSTVRFTPPLPVTSTSVTGVAAESTTPKKSSGT